MQYSLYSAVYRVSQSDKDTKQKIKVMKRLFLLPLLAVATLFTSCDKETNSQGTYPEYVAYATTLLVEEPTLSDEDSDDDDDDEKEYYYVLDNGTKLLLGDDSMLITYKPEEEQRIILYYSIIEEFEDDAEYDASIRLFGVNYVLVGEGATVDTDEESLEIADHALTYIYSNISVSNNYINLVGAYQADVPSKVKIYVVENNAKESDKQEEGYLNLELRYDRDGDEAIGSTYEQYMSLDISSFATQLEGKEGIILRAKTVKSGTVYLKIDIDEDESTTTQRSSTQL